MNRNSDDCCSMSLSLVEWHLHISDQVSNTAYILVRHQQWYICYIYQFRNKVWSTTCWRPTTGLRFWSIHVDADSFLIRFLSEHRPTCHCDLVVSTPAWDGTGCEFDSWAVSDIPTVPSHVYWAYDYLVPFGVLWPYTDGLGTKIVLKKTTLN